MARVVVELLGRHHDRKSFDCGDETLNDFLRTKARKHAEQDISVTWVAIEEGSPRIHGYITLTLGVIEFEDASETIRKGLPKYPIPVLHVGRLATDRKVQGLGIGSRLLRFAGEQAIDLAERVGCFAMDLVAKDHSAYEYYLRRGFRPLTENSMRLYIPVSHLRAFDVRRR